MKKLTRTLIAGAALAICATTSAFAGTVFTVDFEKTWDFGNGDINAYYNGGTAADGSSSGTSAIGVNFTNVSGLSNDPSFPVPSYLNAPSMQAVAYAHTFDPADKAFLNYAAGFSGALSFYYSSPDDVIGALKAYSGVDGTGDLLGTFDLTLNSSNSYDQWSLATFAFSGIAKSFDLTGSANLVALDNITAVPEPGSLALLAGALGLLGYSQQRKSKRAA